MALRQDAPRAMTTEQRAPLASPSAQAARTDDDGQRGELRLGFWLIVGLAAALRLPLLIVMPGIDYGFYASLGRLSEFGFLPFRDYWVEYPPVFPWLAVLTYRFTLLFPPTFFVDRTVTYHVVLGAVMVAADLVIIALIGALGARLWSRAEAERRMILYVALFWPLVVALGWYDTLPCAMLILGLWCILRQQAGAAGALAGLGFMTKIFPIVLAPIAIKFLPGRRERLATLAWAVVVTAAIAVPLLVISPTYFIASYRVIFSRSAWETVWALLDGYFSYGKVAPLGVRFDPTTVDYVAFPSRIPTLPLTLLAALLYAVLLLRPVARTARNAVLFTALSIVGFLLYSKGYSPQFIIYILPFVIVLLPWRRAVGYSLALSAFNLLAWPIYHEWLAQVSWLLGIAVVGRTALLLALAWEWLAELWGFRNPLLALRFSRRLILAGVATTLIAALPLGVLAWRDWSDGYYRDTPLRPAFDFATRHDPAPDGGAAYIFTDYSLYESFYPAFAPGADFYLMQSDLGSGGPIKHPSVTPEGRRAQLAEIARDHQRIFLIRRADDWTSRDLNAWLSEHTVVAAATRVGDADLSFWAVAPPGRVRGEGP